MLNIAGLISIIVFYLIILAIGIWAGRKNSKVQSDEEVMLAGRNIGVIVGVFTMTATWVGGGYINGTSEITYTSGLVWCQAPFGYAISLIFGGLFFAKQMREQGYVTMLDPLQQRFGVTMGGLLYIPALCGEIFWAAAILSALGSTLAVIIDMDMNTSVIASAAIAVAYTLFGGLYSVAYTDVVQLAGIFIGLWISIPFALSHESVGSLSTTNIDWFGELHTNEIGQFVDFGLLLIFGGIPWHVYFQRVLSSKTAQGAQILSYVAAAGCFLMAIPPVLIGAIAKATDWNMTDYGRNHNGNDPIAEDESSMVLPLVLYNLTPTVISFFGLGAVSAAVMSSADSSVLSAASMFSRNVYRAIFRKSASETETMWGLRSAVIMVAAIASLMALTITSVYDLWAMSSDLVYVILFPQLVMVVHFKNYCNTYGSVVAYFVAFFFRFASGEQLINLPALIKFPGFDEESGVQQFPFRTLCMLISIFTLCVVSKATDWLFRSGILAPKYDFLKSVVNIPEDILELSSSTYTQKFSSAQSGEENTNFTED